jgi:hypothetical protein
MLRRIVLLVSLGILFLVSVASAADPKVTITEL